MPAFWLRSAGFPFAWMDRLATPAAAGLARGVVDAEAAADELAIALAGEIAAQFPRGHGAFQRALGRRAQLPEGALPSATAWNAAVARLDAARASLEAAAGAELDGARRALHELLGDARARQAIHAMSRGALTMFDSLCAAGVGARDAKTRYREVEATLFLQRLATKNETVSTFGPLVWGRRGDGEATVVTPSTGAVVDRMVSFEHWAVRALAEALERDEELTDDLPLRLSPACRLEGAALCYPNGERAELAAPTARVAAAVAAGEHSRRSLLDRLAADGVDRAAAGAELDALLKARIAERGLFPPTMTPRSEEQLRQAIAALAPSAARDRWIGHLDRLLAARDRWAGAGGDERLTATLDLDALFQEVTGAGATRGDGAMYVGRALLYEDCAIDGGFTLGGALAARIERALAAPLAICGWIARSVAGALHRRYLDVWRALGEPEVELLRFARAVRSVESDESVLAPVAERLVAAWDALVPPDTRDEEVVLAPAQLDDLVHALPPAELDGPLLGEDIHAPDVLLASADPAALERGDLEIVLGEIHKMVHYEAHPVGWPFCPDRAGVVARLGGLLQPDLPRLMDAPAQHTSRGYHFPAGTVLDAIVPGTSARPGARAVPVSQLCVRLGERGLEVHHRQVPALRAPYLSVMQNLLYHMCDRIPPVAAPARPYLPRVRVGDAVLRRRTWRLDEAALDPVRKASKPVEALVAGARLARDHGLPARLFAGSPVEPKPIFIDLDSPLSLELLIKLARKAPGLKLTECLPGRGALWWRVGGEPHTSELRLTFVGVPAGAEPLPNSPPGASR